MSNINQSISNSEVIPSVETDAFIHNENARFAVGIVAVGNKIMPGRENEYAAYLKLRANVYVDQTKMLSPDALDEAGTERDVDDSRSIHFAIIENAMQSPRLVASMRLIIKEKEDNRPLPIEDFFPEAFSVPAPDMSTEVSRYICRHEDAKTQNYLKWPLFTAALSYIMTNGLKPTYAVVEPPLERSLEKALIPLERIAEPKYVAEYAADNLGLIVDTKKLSGLMGLTPDQAAEIRSHENDFTYVDKRDDTDLTSPDVIAV